MGGANVLAANTGSIMTDGVWTARALICCNAISTGTPCITPHAQHSGIIKGIGHIAGMYWLPECSCMIHMHSS
jgi:hypothetical protein